MKRKLALVAVVATGALAVWAGSASATQVNYFGYNNMTTHNPPANSCDSRQDGWACTGFNNWDRSGLDYNSGDAWIGWGFMNCDSCDVLGQIKTSPGYLTLRRVDVPGAAIYNRVACLFIDNSPAPNGYAYVQCRAFIF
jgi:hypothetical protein